MEKHYFRYAMPFIFLLLPFLLNAQKDFTGLNNAEFNLNFEKDSLWSFDFEVGNRNILYYKEEFDFEALHIEITHITQYKLGDKFKVGGGFRYYTKHLFNTSKQDELRIVQQVSYKKKKNAVSFKHRLRFTQRYRERITLRTRYRYGVAFPLNNQTTKNPLLLSIQTEAVHEFGKYEKPSLGQRLTSEISFQIFKETELSLGLEYRYRDYTNHPYTQLYFLSGASISL